MPYAIRLGTETVVKLTSPAGWGRLMPISMLTILRLWVATWITPRSLAVATIVSTTLCFVSVVAVTVLAVKVSAQPERPADTRAVPDIRPWLSPVSISIERLPLRADGKPRIDVTLHYVNVGREPARSVVVEMRSGTVPQDLSGATLAEFLRKSAMKGTIKHSSTILKKAQAVEITTCSPSRIFAVSNTLLVLRRSSPRSPRFQTFQRNFQAAGETKIASSPPEIPKYEVDSYDSYSYCVHLKTLH